MKLWRPPFLCCLFALLVPGTLTAVQPTVKTVPWVATNPLIPHDTVAGESHTFKGSVSPAGTDFEFSWDFGDGSSTPFAAVTAANSYALGATHTYDASSPVGTFFTARLTVRDSKTGESDSELYFAVIQDKTLPVEVNMAVDQGLWYLHSTMRRDVPVGAGDWISGGVSSQNYVAQTAANAQAFEVNGHLENGSDSNPYTDTVKRALRYIFSSLGTQPISTQSPSGLGPQNPDSNGNGHSVYVAQVDPHYQGGIIMDAIIASGTPGAITTTGPSPANPQDPGVVGRTYSAIIQDMIDEYAWAQSDGAVGGGWRYVANSIPDNSTNQWAAIGMIAGERVFGLTTPQWVKTHNSTWLGNSQQANGIFGYTSSSPIWGDTATTPSGMVQLAWLGRGRGDPQWDLAETRMRIQFPDLNAANQDTTEVLDNYYGLFSFTKSMLLHDSNNDGIAEPLTMLDDPPNVGPAGESPLDWYLAEVSKGDPTDGVARTLVNDQNPAGYWFGQTHHTAKHRFQTAFAITMLNRTVFSSGVPVAVCKIVPNPSVAGQTINLDGLGSFHQDAGKNIVAWEWDLDDDGTFESIGAKVSTSFPAVDDYNVHLRVTDNAVPPAQSTTTCVVKVDTPPIAPTADAGGPYNFCPNVSWLLNGTNSINPDEGGSEIGQPGDTIATYAWELDGDNDFDDAFGANPDVTAYFASLGVGSYNVQLRVTDTTASSYPSSGSPDLSSVASSQVFVRDEGAPECQCVSTLAARPKRDKIQLTWDDSGAFAYNVYRSTNAGGPYTFLATTASTYSTYLDETVIAGGSYFYVVRPVDISGNEICESDEAGATLSGRIKQRRQRFQGR